MTTLVLATIALVAAAVLIGVTWSLVRAMRVESSHAALRRDGVRVTGTVVVTYQIWDQFRHDKGGQSQPASSQSSPVP